MAEYFLDINIFMHAAGKPHKFKEPCVTVLSSVASGDLSAAVDAEVFQEIRLVAN
jgi:predicted nucleic acid-binding protein